ncbi:hypothetical protein ACMD2_13515 [Ananas comosus]|uniref:Uncharacterized protein n=1 Tax=Ananas comosus TaxID=4615 RepID=A0A199VDW3_ANACO|nr:hypothetical protein ACMD2_13515 [Ananas comosus]
MQGEGGVAN